MYKYTSYTESDGTCSKYSEIDYMYVMSIMVVVHNDH